MKYKVLQISYDFQSFQDIPQETWEFSAKHIDMGTAGLDIIDFMEVSQNGQVGVQLSVQGQIFFPDEQRCSQSYKVVQIRTVAVMRKPNNVWLWVYLFDDSNQPVATYCGHDGLDYQESFEKFVNDLKQQSLSFGVNASDEEPFAAGTAGPLERVKDVILVDGLRYTGWGYWNNRAFVPHGCGKKFYSDSYVYGNFKQGVLSGPAINSHNTYMYTGFFTNNRGNGWGLCINCGELVEFGYYQDSQLKVNLTDFVQWYYDGILKKSDRSDENMLSMYTSKETHEVTTLLIGYPPKAVSDQLALACMGFRFKADGSVFVGTGDLSAKNGHYISFYNDGIVYVIQVENAKITSYTKLQDMIDHCFGTESLDEDNPLRGIFGNIGQSKAERIRLLERNKYRRIAEPKAGYIYPEGRYLDLPF